MYKTETHLHVAEVSPCSKLKAAEMMNLYHDASYKTVFITDHFKPVFSKRLGDIPWQEKTAIFLSGYYRAKVAGENLGMNVLMAAEFDFRNCPNHYLAYGITKEFLDLYPEICEKSVEEFALAARMHNVFVVQAHPYRDGKCFPTPEYIDAVEIYNGNPRHNDFNDKAEEFAKEHGLYVTCGSDAHRTEDIGTSAILSEYEIKTADDFISLIKSGQAKLFKGSDMNDLSS